MSAPRFPPASMGLGSSSWGKKKVGGSIRSNTTQHDTKTASSWSTSRKTPLQQCPYSHKKCHKPRIHRAYNGGHVLKTEMHQKLLTQHSSTRLCCLHVVYLQTTHIVYLQKRLHPPKLFYACVVYTQRAYTLHTERKASPHLVQALPAIYGIYIHTLSSI